MASGIKWDKTQAARMKQRLSFLASSYPTATAQMAGEVAMQVIADSINEPPTVPIDTGNLRSSGTFEVISDSSWRSVKVLVGFNTPYAARVHEIPMHFQDADAGNKYLESKLQRHQEQYVRVWVKGVTRRLGMGGMPMAAGGGLGGGSGAG